MTTKANERQVAGNHYSKHSSDLQHWDIVDKFNLDYFQGQITKYVMRWRDKGGVTDLEKARHFLDKYIELETAKKEGGKLEESVMRNRAEAERDYHDGAHEGVK